MSRWVHDLCSLMNCRARGDMFCFFWRSKTLPKLSHRDARAKRRYHQGWHSYDKRPFTCKRTQTLRLKRNPLQYLFPLICNIELEEGSPCSTYQLGIAPSLLDEGATGPEFSFLSITVHSRMLWVAFCLTNVVNKSVNLSSSQNIS